MGALVTAITLLMAIPLIALAWAANHHGVIKQPALLISLVLTPIFALAIYLQLGQPAWFIQNAQLQAIEESNRTLVDELAQRLQENPDDLRGWQMLARSYAALEQWPQAVEAFDRAYQLDMDNPHTMIELAQALSDKDHGFFNLRAQALAATALRIEPNNLEALWLNALVARQQNDLDQAFVHLINLQQRLNKDSEEYRSVSNILKQLEKIKQEAANQE